MNKFNFLASFSFALITLLAFSACEDDNGGMPPVNNEFDRSAFLNAIADSLIIPNFQALQTSVNELASTASDFTNSSNQSSLDALRNAWVQAATDHQHCSAFGFGPGMLLLGSYPVVLAAFPINTDLVESNINDPNFDLPNVFATDMRGFYAVEYLIYGKDISDEDLIAGFDQNRKDHLLLLTNELKATFDDIVTKWTGDYKAEFTETTGTYAGSPISSLYNDWVKDYEVLKNFKIKFPAGLTADQMNPDAKFVEARFSGISRDLIVAQFENTKNIYFGRTRNGQEFRGFDDYVSSVMGGPALLNATVEAIDIIDDAIEALPTGRLSDNVADQTLATLANEMQANTANFKSSMSSLLGLTITFDSIDGD